MSVKSSHISIFYIFPALLVLSATRSVYVQGADGGSDGVVGGGGVVRGSRAVPFVPVYIPHRSSNKTWCGESELCESKKKVIEYILIILFVAMFICPCLLFLVVLAVTLCCECPPRMCRCVTNRSNKRERHQSVSYRPAPTTATDANMQQSPGVTTLVSSTVTTPMPSTNQTDIPTRSQDESSESVEPLVHSSDQHPNIAANIFQSGAYNMRYYQYGRWHGQFLVQLQFNNSTVRGNGTDDVGAFDVTGTYFVPTSSMKLTKQYHRGTGDFRENFGHQVQIELKWNEKGQQFDGQWTVQTATYYGHGIFELKLREHVESV